MRSRRVPVLRLGSRGPGGDARSLRLCSPSVRKRPQALGPKVSTVTGIGGVVVAKRRTVVTFGLVSGLCVSKVPTVTGIGGGRGRETQNCRHFWTRLGSSRLKSANSHRDRGVVVAKPRTVVTLDSSRLFASQKCQQSQGSGGVVVAKPRTVVTSGLASGERREEREEKRRVDRRKERGDRREERKGERRERRERRGERIEEGRERGEEREVRR